MKWISLFFVCVCVCECNEEREVEWIFEASHVQAINITKATTKSSQIDIT